MTQWFNVAGILYGIVVFLIKWSILLQYYTIFVPKRRNDRALYLSIDLTIWCMFIFYFVSTVFEIIMCDPRERIWNLLMTRGHCFSTSASFMATGVFNVFSDFAILVIPLVPIWKLQMCFKKKLRVSAIFAAGIW